MLNQMKIPVRLELLGGFPMAALVLVLLLSFQLSTQKDKLFDRLYQHHILTLNDLLLIQRLTQKTALDAIRLYRTGWAATGKTVNTVNQSLEEAKNTWHSYQAQRTLGESELNRLADQQFEQAIAQYRQWIQPAGSDALQILILNDSTFNMEAGQSLGSFDQSLNTLIQNQLDAASEVQQEAETLTGLLLRAYVYGGSLLVIASTLLAWRIQRSIQQPLHALRNLILDVAHSSNLTLRAKPLGNDEVSQAATALNQLLEHFHGLVQELESNANKLGGHAGQARSLSEQVSHSSTQQNRETTRMSQSLSVLARTIEDVAARSDTAVSLARQADQLSQDGTTHTANSMGSMEALASLIQTTNSIVTELHLNSNNITEVLEVVQSVSGQINLLALNAAIEAARAGQAGRGFAVVAGEVRNLSLRTAASITSIRTLVEQLQSRADQAREAMHEACTQADSNVTYARQSSQTLQEIRASVQEITQLNIDIFTATSDQHTAVRHNLNGIETLNQSTRQLDHDAGESRRISQELAALAAALRTGIQQFTV